MDDYRKGLKAAAEWLRGQKGRVLFNPDYLEHFALNIEGLPAQDVHTRRRRTSQCPALQERGADDPLPFSAA